MKECLCCLLTRSDEANADDEEAGSPDVHCTVFLHHCRRPGRSQVVGKEWGRRHIK